MSVARRCVFYLGGFDPSGPAHYHRMYRDQARLQAARIVAQIDVGPRSRAGDTVAAWPVRFEQRGSEVHTDYQCLRWDDIVRTHWLRTWPSAAWHTLRTTALFAWHGALWHMLTLAWPPFIALFSPALLVLGLALVLPLAAVVVFLLASTALPAWLAVLPAAALVAAGLRAALRAEARFHMRWLMGSYAFTARQAMVGVPELEARLDAFAQRLCDRVKSGQDDEILLVGHSSGTMMAVTVLARALALDPLLCERRPVLSLLTLGHCTPMLSSLPQAQRFRDELAAVADSAIDWVDVTAPPDGCCFALVDPLPAAGLAARPDHPKLLSPRFANLFSASAYAALRRDRFRLHFQYLMASERVGDCDYFAITAGPRLLGERFAMHGSVRDFAGFRLFG